MIYKNMRIISTSRIREKAYHVMPEMSSREISAACHGLARFDCSVDVFPAKNPKTMTYDIPLVSGGESISYKYTGTAGTGTVTSLYFCLPLGKTTSLASSKKTARRRNGHLHRDRQKASGGLAESVDVIKMPIDAWATPPQSLLLKIKAII